MHTVRVTEETFEDEYRDSSNAIRDFLYMYFEISGDCLPYGDFDRAELGTVDPFRYLDVAFEYTYQFRSTGETRFLHEASAVNLLCRLARVLDSDVCCGSAVVASFQAAVRDRHHDVQLQAISLELFAIFDAYRRSRVPQTPALHQAFEVAFSGPEDQFVGALANVLEHVVFPTFTRLAHGTSQDT